jgi:hypothetical protein
MWALFEKQKKANLECMLFNKNIPTFFSKFQVFSKNGGIKVKSGYQKTLD